MHKITRYIPEILDDVVDAKTTEEKVKILKQNDSKPLRVLLHFALHPKYNKPFKKMPEYRADDAPVGFSMSNLNLVYTKLPYLYKEHNMYVASEKKRESLAALIMESVHFTEAALLEQVFARELKQVSLDVAKLAFPEQFKE